MGFNKTLQQGTKSWDKPVSKVKHMRGSGNLPNRRQEIETKLLQKRLKNTKPKKKV